MGLIPAHAGKTIMWIVLWFGLTAHPRSRGENVCVVCDRLLGCGSSPLTRGKLGVRYSVHRVTGLIPAHAGKTVMRVMRARLLTAHPRSRGENCLVIPPGPVVVGSSPLTRGKPEMLPGVGYQSRLIPAHAGKTTRRTRPRLMSPAHPRSRGENSVALRSGENGQGSSPLTRGKR